MQAKESYVLFAFAGLRFSLVVCFYGGDQFS